MNQADDAVIEQLAGAYRQRGRSGEVLEHRAFFDLDATGRQEAHARSLALRQLEAALDPQGYSSTVRAVLAQIQGSDPPASTTLP